MNYRKDLVTNLCNDYYIEKVDNTWWVGHNGYQKALIAILVDEVVYYNHTSIHGMKGVNSAACKVIGKENKGAICRPFNRLTFRSMIDLGLHRVPGFEVEYSTKILQKYMTLEQF